MPLSMREQLRDQSGSYSPRLLAVLFAVFDPTAGPTLAHQVPEGSVATALSTFPGQPTPPVPVPAVLEEGAGMVRSTSGQGLSSTQVLFDFSSILDFVIPKPELCGHLITKATRTCKILGLPVRIFDEKKYHKGSAVYNRNAFIFNLCFVFERDAELASFEPLVRKTARTLRAMEESVSLLSAPPPTFSMANLLEQLFMDINSFSETSIPLHGADLDLMLFPFFANPKDIKDWDVPIAVTAIEEMKNGSWDVTLYKICAFVDGVNNVRRISELAEVEQSLGRLCVQHLLFYSAIVLVDLFQFSNSYAALSGIADIAQYGEEDEDGSTDLRTECEAYTYSGTGDSPRVPFSTLLTFYSSLTPGLSVSAWTEQYQVESYPIDVRRMIQFGVIKGFLRRVYAYPIWLDHPSYTLNSQLPRERERERQTTTNTMASSTRPGLGRHGTAESSLFSAESSNDAGSAPTPRPASPRTRESSTIPRIRTNPSNPLSKSYETPTTGTPAYPPSLPLMFDGTHHTDEICVRYGISLKHLETVMRTLGGDAAGKEGEGGGREWGRREYGRRVVMVYI